MFGDFPVKGLAASHLVRLAVVPRLQTRPWQSSARRSGANSLVESVGDVLGPGRGGFQRGEREARRGEKDRSCKICSRCELARINDARDVRDPRNKGLGTRTSGHQLAALARLHLASRFRLEVKWHVASNTPAKRLQISGQPRDVPCLLLSWSCWYQD